MRILVVTSDKKERDNLSRIISKHSPGSEILCHKSSPEALVYARNNVVDMAFLDMRLQEIDAMILGQYLKDLNPYINLVFMTGRKTDAYEAMVLRASGCLLHSCSEDEICREISELRYPSGKDRPKRAFARTFGNFEFFVDGVPITFKYSRTKEILAMLINNRGAQTTNGEIIANLWEDDGDPVKKGSYLRNLRQDLNNTLTKMNLNDIILKQRGSMAIATDRIECDLFDWLEKKQASRYQYIGDYMNQYSWSEYYHGDLDEISYSFE